MNIFNLKITRNQSTHAKTYISIDDVYVDERHPIDLRELVRGCSESGRFFIFTCGCGDSGCPNIHEGNGASAVGIFSKFIDNSITPSKKRVLNITGTNMCRNFTNDARVWALGNHPGTDVSPNVVVVRM